MTIEELEHRAVIWGRDIIVLAARYFDVAMCDAKPFHLCDHCAGSFDGNRRVGVSVDDKLRNVLDALQCFRDSAPGSRA